MVAYGKCKCGPTPTGGWMHPELWRITKVVKIHFKIMWTCVIVSTNLTLRSMFQRGRAAKEKDKQNCQPSNKT